MMAKKADELEMGKPSGKTSLSKRKFTLIILLLLTIIILLCVIIVVLSTLNVSGTYETDQNSTYYEEKSSRIIFDLNSTVEQPQIRGNLYKMIYRDVWGGRPPLYERPQKLPVKYVIISHTAGAECCNISACSQQMTQIQKFHVNAGSPDIGYNFLIGGDANIYVGRGWNNHNFHMNLDTIGISFIGNYIYDELTPNMIEATHQLLKQGIEEEKLATDYILVAHNQTYNTISPGANVYKQIKFWPHFSPDLLEDIN